MLHRAGTADLHRWPCSLVTFEFRSGSRLDSIVLWSFLWNGLSRFCLISFPMLKKIMLKVAFKRPIACVHYSLTCINIKHVGCWMNLQRHQQKQQNSKKQLPLRVLKGPGCNYQCALSISRLTCCHGRGVLLSTDYGQTDAWCPTITKTTSEETLVKRWLTHVTHTSLFCNNTSIYPC